MFGSQDAKSQAGTRPVPVFDPKAVPAHTMQDDLDALSGKTKVHLSTTAERPAIENKGMGGVSAVPASNSPFMEKPAPYSPKPAENKIPAKVPGEADSIVKESVKANPFEKSVGIPLRASAVPANLSRMVPPEAAKTSNPGKMTGILLGAVLLLAVSAGGYYLYMTRYNTPALELEVVPEEAVPVIPEKKEAVVVLEKFSAEKPNYLMLDVEKMTVADIQKLFVQKSQEMKEDGKTVPIEFVVTDSNNNPIALKIFAKLMDISFSPKLLESFRDEFSVFVFSDGGNIRLGLNLSPQDPAKAMTGVKAEEKSLVKELGPLFLGEATKAQAVSFQDAEYGGTALRYLNLNAVPNLSVDYFTKNNRLIIATSKNTAWAIIDKNGGKSQK